MAIYSLAVHPEYEITCSILETTLGDLRLTKQRYNDVVAELKRRSQLREARWPRGKGESVIQIHPKGEGEVCRSLSSSLNGSTLMCLDSQARSKQIQTTIVMVDIADGAAQGSDRPLSSILYYNVP